MRALLPALVLIVACTGAPPAATPSVGAETVLPTSAAVTMPTATSPPPQTPLAVAAIQELRSSTARKTPGGDRLEGVVDVVSADAHLGWQLYHLLIEENTENLFFSPYSISTALSMAFGGARGDTAEQMRSVLGVSEDDQAWHDARNRLELALTDPTDRSHPVQGDAVPLTLEPTNAIFGQAGYAFRDEYLDLLAADYGAGMQAVDFIGAPEPARLAINDWVAERTHGRIPELLRQGAINALTRAALVNAIYFKGNWVSKFNPDDTSTADFHLLDGSRVDVDMMHASPETRYAAGKGWAAVTLPYWGSASMIVIVPDQDRYQDVEPTIDAEFVAELDKSMTAYEVHLALPKWETSSTIDQLSPQLQQVGMVDAFDPVMADFSGMADFSQTFERLFIDKVVHQANITVDEEGTEAAAATAVLMVGECNCPPPEVTLTVDRPFIYLIRDDVTGEILFIGRLLDP
jgi:serpin B